MTIAISAAFNATSGTGPFYLYCNATGTTSTETSRQFHDIRYLWSVTAAPAGVDLSERYTTGVPMPKWTGYGPVTGFCLEEPGNYTVKLSVWDGVLYDETSQVITIADPDTVFSGTNTICFATDGDFTGAPSGSQQITTDNWNTALTSLAQNKRLLFKRGQTFECTAEWNQSTYVNGPWQLGVFGPDSSKATVYAAGTVSFSNSGMLQIGGYNATNLSDGKVFDLIFDGGINSVTPIWQRGQFDSQLYLRVEGRNCGSLTTYVGQNRAATDHCPRYIGIFDCINGPTKGGSSLQYFMSLYADYLTMRGNFGDQTGGGTHSLRIFNAWKSCISNNTFIGGDNGRHCIKMHSTKWTAGVPYATSDGTSDGGGYTKFNVVNFNLLRPTTSCRWPGAFGNEDSISDERVDDNLVECNFVPSESGNTVQAALYVSGSQNVLRNNVADLSQDGADIKALFMFAKRLPTMPTPTGNEAYNNTVYYSGSQVGFRLAQVDSGVETTGIRSNIAYAPNASSPAIVVDNGTGTVAANNTSNVTTDPIFVGTTFGEITDFVLDSASPYVGQGADLTGYYDAFGNSRGVNGAAQDAGALQAETKQHRLQSL